MILKIQAIKQRKDYCGAACLEMVLSYYKKYGEQYTQEAIGNRYSIDFEGGMTISMLLEALDYYGIIPKRITSKDYRTPDKLRYYLNKYKVPIVLDTLTHYILAIGYNKNNIFIINPLHGRIIRRSDKSDFWKNLTGYTICLRRENNEKNKNR